jgi:hypothetical protein
MALDTNIRGTTGTQAEVTAANELKVFTAGNVNMFTESDPGDITGTQTVYAPQTDEDYRLRIALETYLDQETFNYTAQNTGKFRYFTTTMTSLWTVNGLQTNGGNATTAGNSTLVQTYSYFPLHGVSSTYFQFNAGFNQSSFPTNTNLNFGAFIAANTTTPAAPYTPADGVYFQATSAGLVGVINFNGAETATSTFLSSFGGSAWAPVANKRYNFCITVNERDVEFWIDDVLYGRLVTPLAQGQPFISSSLPLSVQHAITAAPNSNFSMFISDTTVSLGGPNVADRFTTIGNRVMGSYQGLSGGTMGSLANYANSTTPTAFVPSNTTIVAAQLGLGGQFFETATLALNTDGNICYYFNPFGTSAIQGRRLVIRGIGLTSYIQTLIAGGPFINQYSLAFGHTTTTATLGGTEGASNKIARRIALSSFTQAVTSNQAASSIVSQPGGSFMDFGDAPVFVNPGEHVALVVKRVGTVATAGVIAHIVTFVYGWE